MKTRMNRDLGRATLLTLALTGSLWSVALWSYASGNPGAVSALVGIPVGLVCGLAIIWTALHD